MPGPRATFHPVFSIRVDRNSASRHVAGTVARWRERETQPLVQGNRVSPVTHPYADEVEGIDDTIHSMEERLRIGVAFGMLIMLAIGLIAARIAGRF